MNTETSIRSRSILIGLVLVVLNCYWIMMSFMFGGGESATITLIYNVFFSLFLLIGSNLLLYNTLPHLAFNRSELLTIYVMLNMASVIASHFNLQVLIPIIPHAYRFATPENEWAVLFQRYIPNGFAIDNPRVFDDFYRGNSTFYSPFHLLGWIKPALIWSGFLSALLLGMLGLNVLLRQQWTEQEKLSYPLIQLPLEITAPSRNLLKNRLMWLSFSFAFAINLLNGLHLLIPTVPRLISGQQYDMSYLFSEKPFSAIGWTPVSIYPFAIGIAFLMPLDLSFSCWGFYILWKLQKVIGSAIGVASIPQFPYADEQSFGAYVSLGLIALWLTRKHLWHVWKQSIFISVLTMQNSRQPIPYRWAIGLIGFSALFIILFCLYAQMSFWVIVAFFVLFVLLSVGFTRLRAESGILFHDLHFTGPEAALVKTLGTRQFAVSDLTLFSFFFFFNRAHTSNPMPYQLEGFKIAERAKINQRRFLVAMLVTIPVASLAAFWAYLHGVYQIGSGGSFAWGAFNRLHRWTTTPTDFDPVATSFVLIGVVNAILLTILRWKIIWWPFSPIGYAISGSYTMNIFWLSFLIGWTIKGILIKQGGLKAHRRIRPLFFGLILGEFIMGSLWSLISIVTQQPMYDFID